MHSRLRALAQDHDHLESAAVIVLVPLTALAVILLVPYGPITYLALGMILLLGALGLAPLAYATAQPSPASLPSPAILPAAAVEPA